MGEKDFIFRRREASIVKPTCLQSNGELWWPGCTAFCRIKTMANAAVLRSRPVCCVDKHYLLQRVLDDGTTYDGTTELPLR